MDVKNAGSIGGEIVRKAIEALEQDIVHDLNAPNDEKESDNTHRFPKDCWGKNCEHFKVWDLSIDDLCCACELLKVQCDACDEDYSLFQCPKN